MKVHPKAYIRKWGINASAKDNYSSEEFSSYNIRGDPRNSNAYYKNRSILLNCFKSFNIYQYKNCIKNFIFYQTFFYSEKYIRYIIKEIKCDLILIIEEVNN